MITMNSNTSELKIGINSVSSLLNKEEAFDALGKIFGSTWRISGKDPKQYQGKAKKLAVLKKAKRLIKKRMKSLPDRTDKHGNIMVSHHLTSAQYYSLCSTLGANIRGWDNGYTAAYRGDGVTVTYCEGDVMVYTGPKAKLACDDHVDFWFNED